MKCPECGSDEAYIYEYYGIEEKEATVGIYCTNCAGGGQIGTIDIKITVKRGSYEPITKEEGD